MKLSGHNFENDVFNSLLDGLSKDVELKKSAQTAATPDVSDFFSSTTLSDLGHVQREELEFIADELSFAADRARIAVNTADLAKFAAQVTHEGLRGKKLERAAQKFCSNLNRAIAAPQPATKLANELINQLAGHQVIPAGYNPEHGSNNSATGKFMGSSKNPNTIWDTDALTRQAQIALGDEKIKASKQAQEDHKLKMKTAQWEELQNKHSEPGQVHKGITNTGTSETIEVADQKLPANSMSIFSNNRDFENIPTNTVGEEIIAQAEARANKKIASNDEARDIQKPMNTKDALDRLIG